MSEILTIRNLSKSFGRKRVLQDFSLTLAKGKVYGLLGKNGEGKTTLVRILMGVIPADSGEIHYKGRRIRYNDIWYKKEVGYIPEDSFFFSAMRIRELLDFNASFYPAWDGRKAKDYLDRLNLDGRARIGQLSRGMKLKLGLVVALAAKPELLFLDDPTSGIDVPTRQDFLKGIVRELSDAGTTLLFSSHLVHELERIVEHVHILDGGRVILDEEYQALKNRTMRVRMEFEGAAPDALRLPGVLTERREGSYIEAVIYPWAEDAAKAVEALAPARWGVEPLSLEDIFMSFIAPVAKTETTPDKRGGPPLRREENERGGEPC
jgi:ABC-2 type transport system ATP-binding protein